MSEPNKEKDTGFRLVRNSDAEAEVEDNIELNLDAVTDFVAPRAVGTMIAGGIGGMSTAYIAGEAVAVPFYAFGFAGAVVGTTFHAGSYALRYYRKQDDVFNYTSCGAMHGLFIGLATKGYRSAGFYGLGGGLVGAAYYVAGNWLYDASRQAWINHKRNMATAVPREATGRAHPFQPRDDGLPTIPNRYTPVPDDDHSMIANVRRYLQSLDRKDNEKNKK